MDAFSGDAELLSITTAFHTHNYQSVLDYDTAPLSSENKTAASILKYRAQIALGQSRDVLSKVSSSKDPASQSIKALAQHTLSQPSGLQLATQLCESDPEDPIVQILCGTILSSAGETQTALDLLSKHQGNLEAVSLQTQIYLSQNRPDLALKEVAAAKRWAQDSLLINLAEAWVNLRTGPSEKYQSTFHVYEELASAPDTGKSMSSLVGQAVAELHLGRLPEAEAALGQALEQKEADPLAIANSVVLASMAGRKGEDVEGMVERLRTVEPEHALLSDLREKSDLFDGAAAKYTASAAG